MSSAVDGAGAIAFCGGATFLVVSAITLLVVGILGATGHVPMAPVGARIMIGLGVTIILSMIGGAVQQGCTVANK